jgi:predicted nucleotidyltransferase
MLILPVHLEGDILRKRRGGLSLMRKESFSSAKIFWPKLSREEVLRLLAERLPELQQKLPLVLVILFGSYAKGNYTAGSDVDLLVVYRGNPRRDAYEIVWKTLRIPNLEPHVYAEEEYLALKETLERMTKGGIVLYSGGSL